MSKSLQIAVKNWEDNRGEYDNPLCFTEEDWVAWAAIEDITVHTQPIRQFGCRDCTTKYQKKMIDLGNCCNPQLKLTRFAD
jgi:hypothetical protein